jgi:predicted DCC family thiol-disulfide oxidoreductase YuxK
MTASPRATVLFDGDCGVCRALKQFAERHNTTGCLTFTPFQTTDLDNLSSGLTREMVGQALYFIRADGQRFRGARAVFETMKRLPDLWGLVGAILSLPLLSWLAEPFYRLFARRRARISQVLGLDRCQIPDPKRVSKQTNLEGKPR